MLIDLQYRALRLPLKRKGLTLDMRTILAEGLWPMMSKVNSQILAVDGAPPASLAQTIAETRQADTPTIWVQADLIQHIQHIRSHLWIQAHQCRPATIINTSPWAIRHIHICSLKRKCEQQVCQKA